MPPIRESWDRGHNDQAQPAGRGFGQAGSRRSSPSTGEPTWRSDRARRATVCSWTPSISWSTSPSRSARSALAISQPKRIRRATYPRGQGRLPPPLSFVGQPAVEWRALGRSTPSNGFVHRGATQGEPERRICMGVWTKRKDSATDPCGNADRVLSMRRLATTKHAFGTSQSGRR